MPTPFFLAPPSAALIPTMVVGYQGLPYVDLTLSNDALADLAYFLEGFPYVPPASPPVSGGVIIGGLGRAKAIAPPYYPISDEGGEVVTYRPQFDLTDGGPFAVQLIDGSADAWPEGVAGCWGAVPGYGAEIYPSRAFDSLTFITPPLPLGTYALRITDGSGVIRETISGVFEVLRRARPWPIGYATINLLPPKWPAGPRIPQAEAFAEATNRPPYNGWQAMGKTLGWFFHNFASAPCTRLLSDLSPGDTEAFVETTFLFESAWGQATHVWIDGVKVRFFGVNRATRAIALTSADLALNRERTTLEHAIPGGTPVVLDTRGMPHPGRFAEPDLGNDAQALALVYEYTNNALMAPATTGTIVPFTSLVFWSRLTSAGFGGWVVRGGGVYVAALASGDGYKLRFGLGTLVSTRTFTFDTRYCIAVTTDGSNHRLYVDGVQESIYAGVAPFGSGGVTFLGWPDSDAGGTFYPRRYAANIAFFDALLAITDLVSIYTAGPTFDMATAFDTWAGAIPRAYYTAEPDALVVSSQGAEAIDLTLNASCEWAVLSV